MNNQENKVRGKKFKRTPIFRTIIEDIKFDKRECEILDKMMCQPNCSDLLALFVFSKYANSCEGVAEESLKSTGKLYHDTLLGDGEYPKVGWMDCLEIICQCLRWDYEKARDALLQLIQFGNGMISMPPNNTERSAKRG